MADTTYLTGVVEPFIVNWVAQKIGIPLRPRSVIVGEALDGRKVSFAFDGVSEDGSIGLLVSCSQTVKAGATRKLHTDASTLNRALFTRRIMAFASRDVRQNFLNKCDGLIDLRGIEMFVCDVLPAEMLAQIAIVQNGCKSEVGDKGKIWKVGGPRR